MERPLAITNHNICMKCLQKDATHVYTIYGRGYGSVIADQYGTHFQLCDDCHDEKYNVWVNETPEIIDEYCEDYKHEEDILDFIHSLSLESQELFYNKFDIDKQYEMKQQDWIDYKLNLLSYEQCKEYHLYSYEEKQAYYDRFPTCNKVFLKVYKDNSSACYCDRQARGNGDGTCDVNISKECYMCSQYETKDDSFTIKTVNEREEFYKREKQRLEEMIIYATLRLEKLSNNELEEEY